MNLFSKSPDELANALLWPSDYQKIIHTAKYHHFSLTKKDGGFRKIEAPGKKLKFLQKTFANALQLFYLRHIPDCVHGYVSGINPEVGSRHILTNAKAHQGAAWLLNLDFDDFFPSIDSIRILDTFRHWFPKMPSETAELLTLLCTRKNTLPMGAPSSPVLSNFCMIQLDEALTTLCASYNVTYTRYVDDLSFSSHQPILEKVETEIRKTVADHQLQLNEDKRKLYGPNDVKLITGLILDKEKIGVQKELLKNIQRCIKSYDKLKWLEQQMDSDKKWLRYKLKSMEQSIKGQLNFLQQILGKEDKTYLTYQQQFKKAKKKLPPSFDFYF